RAVSRSTTGSMQANAARANGSRRAMRCCSNPWNRRRWTTSTRPSNTPGRSGNCSPRRPVVYGCATLRCYASRRDAPTRSSPAAPVRPWSCMRSCARAADCGWPRKHCAWRSMMNSVTGARPSAKETRSPFCRPLPADSRRSRALAYGAHFTMEEPLFSLHETALDPRQLRERLHQRACGGCVAFEGWVRDHNEGRRVLRLEYEAFAPLAVREGQRILQEARERFGVQHLLCAHRVGALEIGDIAVWVGVSAAHRGECFEACRYIIDEVKHRVPIWKKEHYESGDSGWVNCERCAQDAGHTAHREHAAAAPEHAHHGHSHAAGPKPDYSRQIALKEVGAAGQAKLRRAAVLVVGCGG